MLSTKNISSDVELYDDLPEALGVAAAGTEDKAARGDHVHAALTSAGISDATAAGRTLLTAADATAQKTALSLAKADVGLGNVDNTSDTNKPVSSAQQTALNLKANIASPTFTGSVSGITASMVGAYTTGEVDALLGGGPSYPAVVALVLTDNGSHSVNITATVTVGGVAVNEAVVEFWVHYPWGTIASWSTTVGSQVSLSNPGYVGGGTCANSTAIVRTNSSGVARVFYGGTATGGTLYASAVSKAPASAMATSSRTIPA